MYDLTGRVALVTGAGPNIGRAIAAALAEAGAFVLCNDLKREVAEETARIVRQATGRAAALPGDITDPAEVARMVDGAVAERGPIRILVNNAGISIPKGLLAMSHAEWQRNTRVVLDGAFLMSQAVARHLVAARQPGVIVNIASTSGHRGRRNAIAYTTAKAGLLNFTRSAAVELARHGIRVVSVSPTKTGPSLAGAGTDTAATRDFSEIPMGRGGRPEDHAQAVVFLASDAAAFITGEDLRVDGGSLATWGTKSHGDPAV
jgi:NAD(P)-dependent dehydrogenase (short-subunit alcohol dehydrogenase family)